jgi:hypothetical protein
VLYGQPENKFLFDVDWLNATPNFGNEVTLSEVLQLCDKLLSELKLNTGMAGRVREIFLRVRPETSRWIAEFSEHEAD